MARVYAPKPPIGALGLLLKGKTAKEKQQIRTKAMADLPSMARTSFKVKDITISIESGPTLMGNRVRFVVASAVTDGGVYLPIDMEGYDFVNPPLTRGDGTWRQDVEHLPDETPIPVEVENQIEDVEGVAKLILYDAIVGEAKRRGAL
jgi:hypothetical protein